MNETRCYPTRTANPNVPKDVFLVAEWSTMSGEIGNTVYITRGGDMFKVCDWVDSKPHPVTFSNLWQIVGDTPQMISRRWAQWSEVQS